MRIRCDWSLSYRRICLNLYNWCFFIRNYIYINHAFWLTVLHLVLQCQSQLKTLYAEGIKGCHLEFAAYNLLCVILHSNNNRDLLSAMSRLVNCVDLPITLVPRLLIMGITSIWCDMFTSYRTQSPLHSRWSYMLSLHPWLLFFLFPYFSFYLRVPSSSHIAWKSYWFLLTVVLVYLLLKLLLFIFTIIIL